MPDIFKGVADMFSNDSKESEELEKTDIDTGEEKDRVDDTELETNENDQSETLDEDNETEKEEDGVSVDEDIYQAAIDRGMTDEQILEASEKYPELLEALRPAKQEILSADEKIKVDDKLDPMNKIEITEKDLEALKKVGLDETITSVVGALNNQIEAVNQKAKADAENQAKAQKEELNRQVLTANKKMDEWSKKFPELGTVASMKKTADGQYDVNSSQFKKREQIFNIAQTFLSNGMSGDFDDALTQAYNWLVGSNPDSVKREIVADINSRKKHFIARPTDKKMKKAKKSNSDDSFMDSIGEFVSKNIE